MIRQKLTVGIIASAFTLSLAPAWAGQRSAPDGQSGSRPSNGETVGTAVPRDSGGSSGSSGGSSSGRSSGSSESGSSTSSTRGSSGGSDRGDGRSRENVPTYSRPREGRQPVGSAVERRGARPGTGGGSGSGSYYPGVFYDPYYSYYNFNDPFFYTRGGRYSSYWTPYGYGYGLGYLAYDPFLSGAYGGYGAGYGPGYGGYDPYQGGYGSSSNFRGVGSLRLKVKPSDAQVYVDGYYVGVIDSYDGAFQKLNIEEGPHKVEVRGEGYEPVQFDVMVIPGETITYKGELTRRP